MSEETICASTSLDLNKQVANTHPEITTGVEQYPKLPNPSLILKSFYYHTVKCPQIG